MHGKIRWLRKLSQYVCTILWYLMFMYLHMLSWPVSHVDVYYVFLRDAPQPDLTKK